MIKKMNIMEEKMTICICVNTDVGKEFERVAGLLEVTLSDFIAGLMENCVNDKRWRENIK